MHLKTTKNKIGVEFMSETKTPTKRKKEIEERLVEIVKEQQACDANIEELKAQLEKTNIALSSGKIKRDEAVSAKMDEIFGSGSHSAKGIADEVLKIKMSEGSLNQLRDTKAKLKASIKWNTNKKIKLEAEKGNLQKKLDDINIDADCKAMHEAYEVFKFDYFNSEKAFNRIKSLRNNVASMDPRFAERFQKLGIEDKTFFNLVTSRIRPQKPDTSMLTVISELTRLYGFSDNEFYDDLSAGRRQAKTAYHKETYAESPNI
jgi:chromosome segregation ATPase